MDNDIEKKQAQEEQEAKWETLKANAATLAAQFSDWTLVVMHHVLSAEEDIAGTGAEALAFEIGHEYERRGFVGEYRVDLKSFDSNMLHWLISEATNTIEELLTVIDAANGRFHELTAKQVQP